jgi:hypothetical protein
MLNATPRVVGGAHLTIADDSRISYRMDPDGDVHFTVLGPMELEMLMSPTTLKRCHELFTEAVAQVHGSTEADS